MSPAEVDQRSKNKVIELLMWRFKGAGRGKVKVDVVRGQQRLYVIVLHVSKVRDFIRCKNFRYPLNFDSEPIQPESRSIMIKPHGTM